MKIRRQFAEMIKSLSLFADKKIKIYFISLLIVFQHAEKTVVSDQNVLREYSFLKSSLQFLWFGYYLWCDIQIK